MVSRTRGSDVEGFRTAERITEIITHVITSVTISSFLRQEKDRLLEIRKDMQNQKSKEKGVLWKEVKQILV